MLGVLTVGVALGLLKWSQPVQPAAEGGATAELARQAESVAKEPREERRGLLLRRAGSRRTATADRLAVTYAPDESTDQAWTTTGAEAAYQRLAAFSPDPVAAPQPEPAAVYEPEPEPEPVAVYEPEAVAEYEPEPVAVYEPEPDPVAVYEPEPVAVYEPEPVAVYEPEPEPVAVYEAEPEPVVAYEPADEELGVEFDSDEIDRFLASYAAYEANAVYDLDDLDEIDEIEELDALEEIEAPFESSAAPESAAPLMPAATATEVHEPEVQTAYASDPAEHVRLDDEAWERLFGMLAPSEEALAAARAAHGLPHPVPPAATEPHAASAAIDTTTITTTAGAEAHDDAPGAVMAELPSAVVVPEQRSSHAELAAVGGPAKVRRCGVCRETGHDRRRCPSAQPA